MPEIDTYSEIDEKYFNLRIFWDTFDGEYYSNRLRPIDCFNQTPERQWLENYQGMEKEEESDLEIKMVLDVID